MWDLESEYLEWMEKYSGDRVELNIALGTLDAMIASLQLALRHPHFPPSIRERMLDFIRQTIGTVAPHHPVVAEAWRRGNDPTYDVPAPRIKP